MKTYPIGTVVVPCQTLARYSRFALSLATVDLPDGSLVVMRESMDVTSALNDVISNEMVGEWLWIMGDDHVFHQRMLLDLLDRDVDVVVPLCAKKSPPFRLVAFSDSELREHDDGVEYPHYTYLDLETLPEGGLVEVHAAGSAGMLVRKRVLDAVGEPWFENSAGTVINDDLEFCRKVREAGFKIHLDVEQSLGHIGAFTVYPSQRDGVWGITFDFGGKGTNAIFMAAQLTEGAPA